MLKIVCDENIPLAQEYFSPIGELYLYSGREITSKHVQDADVLLVRSVTQVDRRLLEGSKLSFVGTATIGEDHIDKAYLSEAGMGFSSAPGCNANSVAEYVLAALFDWWENPRIKKSVSRLDQLCVGIVGAGNVGSRVKHLCDVLNITAFCYDPFKEEWAHIEPEALSRADVVSFHTPLTKGGPYPTYHFADQAFIKQLKPGALLLNSGRGEVMDNLALLQSGRDLHIGLDVWENEPSINPNLLRACYLATPHIAGYSYDGKVMGTHMLHQAVCAHLGLDSPVEASNDRMTLEIPSSALRGGQSIVADCVRYAYDIRKDDARLRKLFESTDDDARLSQGFDDLRKNYPKRREFSCYKLAKEGVALSEQKVLEGLGFKLV